MHRSEELRFINNLSVLLECGRPLLESLRHLKDDCHDTGCLPAYEAMLQCTERGGHFTDALADFPQLVSRSSLALLKAARRSSCIGVVLPKLARLVRRKAEGELDPRRRFLETWALFAESGFTTAEALAELAHDFAHGPLGEIAEGLRAAADAGNPLAEAAKRFPEAFDAASRDLLRYGEARDLASALRAMTRLI